MCVKYLYKMLEISTNYYWSSIETGNIKAEFWVKKKKPLNSFLKKVRHEPRVLLIFYLTILRPSVWKSILTWNLKQVNTLKTLSKLGR